MILTAHQPTYLPWIGLFHKIAIADLFCFFDIVQYQKKDFNNRNKIKTPQGEIWLSVPVESKNHFNKNVSNIKIIQNSWSKKHLKSIFINYKKAPYFEQYYSPLEILLSEKSQTNLGCLNLAILKYFMSALNINTPIVLASEYNFSGTGSDLVLNMCRSLKASQYIFGAQGKNYASIDKFKAYGISTYFQDYKHPSYKQLHGGFLPYMSLLDLLFNEGSNSLKILMSDNIQKNELIT